MSMKPDEPEVGAPAESEQGGGVAEDEEEKQLAMVSREGGCREGCVRGWVTKVVGKVPHTARPSSHHCVVCIRSPKSVRC